MSEEKVRGIGQKISICRNPCLIALPCKAWCILEIRDFKRLPFLEKGFFYFQAVPLENSLRKLFETRYAFNFLSQKGKRFQFLERHHTLVPWPQEL